MYRSLLIICAFALGLCVQAKAMDADSVPVDEEDVYFLLMGQADEAIKDQKYEDAAARLVEAMGVRPGAPTNVILMSNLGMVYSLMDRDSLALVTLDRAHEMAPSMVTVLDNRARVNLKLGRDKAAYDDFGRVIGLDSINHTARYYHGLIALYGGDAATAGEDFRILNKYYPKLHETQVAMAAYHSLLRNDLEAIPYYKNLVESDPSPEYYAALAGCYLALDRLGDASETLAEGIRKFPQDAELYYYRAWLNRERYLFEEAHKDAEKAVKLGADPRRVARLFDKD